MLRSPTTSCLPGAQARALPTTMAHDKAFLMGEPPMKRQRPTLYTYRRSSDSSSSSSSSSSHVTSKAATGAGTTTITSIPTATAVAVASTSTSSTALPPPLLFSKVARQSYALLQPIEGLATGKAHVQVHLAAPIVVLRSPLQSRNLPAQYVAQQLPPSSADVLYYPHPTKRVVVKKICRAWLAGLAAFSGGAGGVGAPVGEVQALRLLQESGVHPHVIPLIDTMVDEEFYYLIMPYMDGGELFALVVDEAGGLGEREAKTYFREVVAGLVHLKRHGLAHGDLALENIMLAKKQRGAGGGGGEKKKEEEKEEEEEVAKEEGACAYTCRIIDLGLARATSAPSLSLLSDSRRNGTSSSSKHGHAPRLMGGKAGYVAPEVVAGTAEDWHAADIWSLGVCLYNMLTGMTIYTHPSEDAFQVLSRPGGAKQMLRHHMRAHHVPLPPLAAHLIAAMLSATPEDRPSLEDIALHPWVYGEARVPDE